MDAGSVELQLNDPANWKHWDNNGNEITESVLPSKCTNVIIPGNESHTIAPMQSFIITTKNLFTDSIFRM